MAVLRVLPLLTSPLLAAVLFCWTLVGETSNPNMSARDLPRAILNVCDTAACADDEFRLYWIGRTQEGDLFIVGRTACPPADCPNWLVLKRPSVAQSLLEMRGSYHLRHDGGHRYPTVEIHTRSVDDGDLTRARFEWNGSAYRRTAMQRVYEVSGVECGTRQECHTVAERAFRADQTDRALRIWQEVHGVSWI